MVQGCRLMAIPTGESERSQATPIPDIKHEVCFWPAVTKQAECVSQSSTLTRHLLQMRCPSG